MLEHIERVAGGWSLTFVLAQRELHWCLTTQTCLLLFYILSTYEYSSFLRIFPRRPGVKISVKIGGQNLLSGHFLVLDCFLKRSFQTAWASH